MCWFKILWSRNKISVRRNKDMFLIRQRKSVGQRTADAMSLCCMVESSCGTEPPVGGQMQAVGWDQRRVKAAKWPLCLILAECSTYAWESHLCLRPVAAQIFGWWRRWDCIAHVVEMWVLLQNRVMMSRVSPTVLYAQLPLTPDQEHEPFLRKIIGVCHCRLVPYSRTWRQRTIAYEELYYLG